MQQFQDNHKLCHQTRQTDDTMEILQPCVQNQSDTNAHVHSTVTQETATSTASDNQPKQNIVDLLSALLQKGQCEPPTANL